MNIFVTASNKNFSSAKETSLFFAKKKGRFDKCISYDIDCMIDKNFKNNNHEIFSIKKGAGLWLWKPYFIYKALIEECNEGDILFYLDAAAFFIRNVNHITKNLKSDFFICQLPFIEEEFTKVEAFKLLNLYTDEFTKTRQIQASLMAFRKNSKTVKFVNDWLTACCNIDLLSNTHSLGKQVPNFVDHRMDQSLFSLLCKKNKIVPQHDPTQYGILGYRAQLANTFLKIDSPKEYPVTILLHRRSKVNWIWVIATVVWINMPKSIIHIRNKYLRNEIR